MNQKQTLILVALASLITGAVLDRIIFTKTNTFGTLKIDKTGEKDLYNIELDDLENISNKRRVILKVETTREIQSL